MKHLTRRFVLVFRAVFLTLLFASAGPYTLFAQSDVLISEILYDGKSLIGLGLDEIEWIEVYNPGPDTVDLAGWTLVDPSPGLLEFGSHTVSSSVILPPGGYATLCNPDALLILTPSDGEATLCTYTYNGIDLHDASDEVELHAPSNRVVDSVHYGGAGWPSPPEGTALVFTGLVSADNADASNWSAAPVRLGYLDTGPNTGSPGLRGPQQRLPVVARLDGVPGWRFLAPPVTGLTVGHVADQVHVQGLSDLYPNGFPNLYLSYNSPADSTNREYWVPATSVTNALNASTGYLLYVYPKEVGTLLSFDGYGVTGDVTTTSLPRSRKWHFLGNPFPNPVDLDGVNLAARGFQTSVQVWNPGPGGGLSGSYEILTANAAVDADAADDLAPHQGFFAEHDISGSPVGFTTLTFDFDAQMPSRPVFLKRHTNLKQGGGLKRTADAPVSFASRTNGEHVPMITLPVSLLAHDASGALVARDRAAMLVFHPDARAGWDAWDATKLAPLDGSPTTVGFDAVDGRPDQRAVASYPLGGGAVTAPLAVLPGPDPVASLTLAWDASALPADWTATLHVGDAVVDLRAASRYTLPDAVVASLRAASASVLDKIAVETTGRPPASGDSFVQPVPVPPFPPIRKATLPSIALHVGPSAPLPVELARFSASTDRQSALLSWTTLSESESARFHVDRQSGTDDRFVTVATRPAAGTSDAPRDYRVRLDGLAPGVHTFRLRQVDRDGPPHLLGTTDVTIRPADALTLSAAPNPIRDAATVAVAVDREQRVRLVLFDVLGRAVRTLHDGPVTPSSPLRVRLQAALPSGLYLLRATGASTTQTLKVHVVR